MKRKKWAAIVCLFFALLILLLGDVQIANKIKDKSQEEYVSYGYGTVSQEITKESITTKLSPICDRLDAMELCGSFSAGQGDTMSYILSREDGSIVAKENQIPFIDIYDKERERITIDCRGLELERGAEYKLETIFALKTPGNLSTDADGAVCAQIYTVEYQGVLWTILGAINLFAIGFVSAFLRWGWNDRIFLAMSLTVGLLAVVLTVPFARDDEFRHFVRAYDLATGGENYRYCKPEGSCAGIFALDEDGKGPFVEIPWELDELRRVDYTNDTGAGGYVSEINIGLCLPKVMTILSKQEIKESVLTSETGTNGRTIFAYWPQVMMIALGRMLGVRSFYLYYLACAGQAIAVSFILWGALLLTKNHKNLIWFVSFIQVSTLLFASANSDGLMIAEVVLALSLILHIRDNNYNSKQLKFWICLLCHFFLTYQIYTNKLPYALLCLGFLPLLIREKPRKKSVVIAMGFAVIFGVAAFLQKSLMLRAIYSFVEPEHFSYWMEHFRAVTWLMLRKGKELTVQSWNAIAGSANAVKYHWLALVVLLFSKRVFGWIQKCYQVLLYLVMLGLVVVFGYTLTPPDYGSIWGVTFRYILPFLPMLGLALPLGTNETEETVNRYYPILFIPIIFTQAMHFGIMG